MVKTKRFVDDGYEAIEEQSFTDTLTDETYYVDYFDEIVELVNNLHDEKEEYKGLVETTLLDAIHECKTNELNLLLKVADTLGVKYE